MDFFQVRDIEKIGNTIHSQNIEKGFWEEVNSKHRQCCLIVSELSEAIEADRKGKYADMVAYLKAQNTVGRFSPQFFYDHIKDTVEDEIADTWIRLVDWHYYLLRNLPEIAPVFQHVHSIRITDDFEENIANIMEEVLLVRKSFQYLNFARYSIELLAESMGFSLELHVHLKMQYNKHREKYHGKAY